MIKCYLVRVFTIVAFLLVIQTPFLAAETDPRDAIPAPAGTSASIFYYKNMSADEYRVDGAVADDNAKLNVNIGIARYVHYWGIGNWTINANIIQPFGNMQGELPIFEADQQSSGIGDTTVNVTIWSPAWQLQENSAFWMAVGVYLTAPTGQYETRKLFNLGENRWKVILEFAPVIWKYKAFTLELLADLDIYTDNDEYTANSLTLAQDPLLNIYGHITYDLTKSFWIGFSYLYQTGGEKTINGVAQNDDPDKRKVILTTTYQVTLQTQLMLQYAADIDMQNGFPTNAIQARFAYFF